MGPHCRRISGNSSSAVSDMIPPFRVSEYVDGETAEPAVQGSTRHDRIKKQETSSPAGVGGIWL